MPKEIFSRFIYVFLCLISESSLPAIIPFSINLVMFSPVHDRYYALYSFFYLFLSFDFGHAEAPDFNHGAEFLDINNKRRIIDN